MRRLSILLLTALLGATAALASPAGAEGPEPRVGASTYLSVGSHTIYPIPDNNPTGVSSDLVVPLAGEIVDLDLDLMITHTWVGDLKVTLTHLDTGTSAVLIDRPRVPATTFGCSGDNLDAILDDEATLPIEDQCVAGLPAIAGSFTPNNPLSVFDGESLSGTWQLTVVDLGPADIGSLTDWVLLFGVVKCNGIVATIVGTSAGETIIGTPGPDVIAGLRGNDTIYGQGGGDVMCGGPGADSIYAVADGLDDTIAGGPGNDTTGFDSAIDVDLVAGTASGDGNDTVIGIENVEGSPFGDTITGGPGANKLVGGGGDDILIGLGGSDRLSGDAGQDQIYGNGGNDILFGGDGNDTLAGDFDDDQITGGAGNDTANGGPGVDACSAETMTFCSP
jgi:subtilisin-like proprotein convertase family protein